MPIPQTDAWYRWAPIALVALAVGLQWYVLLQFAVRLAGRAAVDVAWWMGAAMGLAQGIISAGQVGFAPFATALALISVLLLVQVLVSALRQARGAERTYVVQALGLFLASVGVVVIATSAFDSPDFAQLARFSMPVVLVVLALIAPAGGAQPLVAEAAPAPAPVPMRSLETARVMALESENAALAHRIRQLETSISVMTIVGGGPAVSPPAEADARADER